MFVARRLSRSYYLVSKPVIFAKKNIRSSHTNIPYRMSFTKELIVRGSGKSPSKGSNVSTQCTGFIASTKSKFWSTLDPGGRPFNFQVGVGMVIRGMDEGIMSMNVGEKCRITIPSQHAYGPSGFPAWNIPPNADLIFEIELLSVE